MIPPRLILYAALGAVLVLGGCSKAKEAPKVYSMGERVELGHLVYTIYETQWLTHVGSGPEAKVPTNRFFMVRINAANTSGGELFVPAMTIEADNGQTFDEVSNGDGLPNWLGLVRRVEPIEPLQGNIAFDAPPAHYKLLITDENQEKSAYVNIPLTFSAETGTAAPSEQPLPDMGPAASPASGAPFRTPHSGQPLPDGKSAPGKK